MSDILRGIITFAFVLSFISALSEPKIKGKLKHLPLFVEFIIVSVANVFIYPTDSYNTMGVFIIIGIIPLLLILKIFYKGTMMQWIFNITTALNIFCIIVFVSYWLAKPFSTSGYIIILIRVIIMSGCFYLLIKYFRNIYLSISKNWHYFIFPSSIVLTLFVSLYLSVGDLKESMNKYTLLFVLLIILAVSVYIALFRLMNALVNEKELRNQTINSYRHQDALKLELDLEKEFVRIAKTYRHDLRHHNSLLIDYLEKGKIKDAIIYLQEYESSLVEKTLTQYCDNVICNSSIRMMVRKCDKNNILYDINCQVPNDLPLSNPETGVLFGNLLENAVDAAIQCIKPCISLTSKIKDNTLYFEVINSVKEIVVFDNGFPITTKENSEGIGTKSMDNILKKYKGMINFRQDEDRFISQIVLPL